VRKPPAPPREPRSEHERQCLIGSVAAVRYRDGELYRTKDDFKVVFDP
jgi:hypothetical protein